jgi:ribosomal protein S18 acetylase RimI-like enzyme
MSFDDVVLRPIREGDEDFLRRVYGETRREELDQVVWEEGAREAFLQMQFEAQSKHYFQHYPGATFFVIEARGEAIGRLYFVHWPREIRVIDIALLPEARNRGIGGMLMENILTEARAGGKLVSIHVEKHNPAILFYQRLGFAPVEDKGVYWLMECNPASTVPVAVAN